MKIYQWTEMSEARRSAILTRPALASDSETSRAVAELVESVRTGGDACLVELSRKYDGVQLAHFEVSPEEFEDAHKRLTRQQHEALARASENIERFHRAQLADAIDMETEPGVRCERVFRPIQRVGLYVPAGTAPLPSTALMLGIPARLAGCPTRVICTPARAEGRADSAVLCAARLVGVQRVFKIGGAQAIAAMAFGTETVPKVDKIFGPGNTWVTAAKALVSRDPAGAALDMPAGPSEVLVIADQSADPRFVAADLLSQAEHGEDSQVLLITTSARCAERTIALLEAQLESLSREDLIRRALTNSAILLVDDLETAMELANRYAPEHLILQLERPRRWVDRIHSAGSVFLGSWTPESIGDYCSGTNHVLPTYGYARCYSSLGVQDFTRAMTIQELTPRGLAELGPVAETLARLEGLDAHAGAVSVRLQALQREARE